MVMILTLLFESFALVKNFKKIGVSEESVAKLLNSDFGLPFALFIFLLQTFIFIYFITSKEIKHRDELIKRVKEEIERRLKASILQKHIEQEFSESHEEVKSDIGQKKEQKISKFATAIEISPGSGAEKEVINEDLLYEYFQKSNQFLMILGQAGIGKTTNMLKLAEKVLEDAEKDSKKPVPVIFELSTWDHQEKLEDWFQLELEQKYNLKKSDLIEEELILPFLDGLDEQKRDLDECIKIINQYKGVREKKNVLICSRIEEYQENTYEKVLVYNQAILQPLDIEEVFHHLKTMGTKELEKAVRGKKQWFELLRTPLFLTLFTEAFKRTPEKVVEYSEPDETEQGRENCQKFLFDNYLETAYNPKKSKYSIDQVKTYVQELACQLKYESKNEFDLDDMQPYLWLRGKDHQRFRLIFGLIGGLNFKAEIDRFESLNFTISGPR